MRARVDKIFTGLATNQTAVFQATIYSYNLKGRSERVTLPKMTLDAEECCHAAVSHHYLVELPNFDIDTAMNTSKHSEKVLCTMCPMEITYFDVLMSKLM